MKNFITSIKVFIVFSLLLGLVYPLTITGIAQATMKDKANGSLIVENGQIVGSSLIGQKFDKPEYFNSRPSAVDYNAAGSGASNFGPTNKKFIAQVEARVKSEKEKVKRNLSPLTSHLSPYIPADMVLASASGLDPHISLENAQFQIPRIAKVRNRLGRNVSETEIKKLVDKNTDSDFVGVWGQPGVNVLKLNIALDKEFNKEGK